MTFECRGWAFVRFSGRAIRIVTSHAHGVPRRREWSVGPLGLKAGNWFVTRVVIGNVTCEPIESSPL